MTNAALALVLVAWLVTVPATLLARALGRRLNALDGPGVAGQVKAASRRVPNTGGIALTAGIVLPVAVLLSLLAGLEINLREWSLVPADLANHLPGIKDKAGHAWALLGALLGLHVVGLVDDRTPLGPGVKLVAMLGAAAGVAWYTDTRLLTTLDAYTGGAWASLVLTVLWIAVVTNAVNFLDNMDGLAAGVVAIASSCVLAAALLHGQWFVASLLALLVGSCGGFLVYNFPWRPSRGGASIFMGDGGSLVIGFLLAFLTVRTTYYESGAAEGPAGPGTPFHAPGGWYGVLMPLVALAVPLYDFASVVVIRLSQGRSPFVGDLQHLSHRLVQRGLSRRAAVLVIYGLTAVTSIGGVALGSLRPWQAALVGAQTVLVLLVLAVFEHRAANGSGDARARGAETPGSGA